jgi:hypothetical protein
MLPTIPQDKAGHAIYGAILALGVYIVMLNFVPADAAAWAVGMAMGAGAVKEAQDRWLNLQAQKQGLPPPHSVELMDAVSTSLGGWFVYVVAKATEAFL